MSILSHRAIATSTTNVSCGALRSKHTVGFRENRSNLTMGRPQLAGTTEQLGFRERRVALRSSPSEPKAVPPNNAATDNNVNGTDAKRSTDNKSPPATAAAAPHTSQESPSSTASSASAAAPSSSSSPPPPPKESSSSSARDGSFAALMSSADGSTPDPAELAEELKQGFGSRAEYLFFAQSLGFILIAFAPFSLDGVIDFLGAVSLAAGFGILFVAGKNLGRNLSPMPVPREDHNLIKSGMFAYMRHPMYAGSLMGALGLSAVTHSETRLALTVGLFVILEMKVAAEEKALCARYPEEYPQYQREVKKFFPFIY